MTEEERAELKRIAMKALKENRAHRQRAEKKGLDPTFHDAAFAGMADMALRLGLVDMEEVGAVRMETDLNGKGCPF